MQLKRCTNKKSVILYCVQSDIFDKSKVLLKLSVLVVFYSHTNCRRQYRCEVISLAEQIQLAFMRIKPGQCQNIGTAPMSSPVSRVLSFKTVIYLRRISLYSSSRLSDYRPDKPIQLTLLRMGFTWHKALPQCRWALTPPFHPYPQSGRFISVALSLESPPPGFLRHPVL